MTKAIETGLPKMRIEEASARRQARIDSGREVIVGINKYRVDHEEHIDVLRIDNKTVRDNQLKRLAAVRAARDQKAVEEALNALTKAAADKNGNLLELAVIAARLRATLGEISECVGESIRKYHAPIRTISGVYSSESKDDAEFQKARTMAQEFEKAEGRRPRLWSPRWAKTVTTAEQRSSPPRLPTSVLTSMLVRSSKLRAKSRKWPLRTTYTSSASPLSPAATKLLFPK